jgi:hypothetical protein
MKTSGFFTAIAIAIGRVDPERLDAPVPRQTALLKHLQGMSLHDAGENAPGWGVRVSSGVMVLMHKPDARFKHFQSSTGVRRSCRNSA